jgi:type III pantothenate kinase
VASLPSEDASAWLKQWHDWQVQPSHEWIIAGVQPARIQAIMAWLKERTASVHLLKSHQELPIQIEVEHPEKVGMDRLLNAVAANRRRQDNVAAILIDAGTAVTVDYVDGKGVFRGGTIFPGFRLMTTSLHEHTALLPLIDLDEAVTAPGTSTAHAIQAGVFFAVLGGIERIINEYQHHYSAAHEIYLTGGDAKALASRLRPHVHLWPEMTLDGILHSRPR